MRLLRFAWSTCDDEEAIAENNADGQNQEPSTDVVDNNVDNNIE